MKTSCSSLTIIALPAILALSMGCSGSGSGTVGQEPATSSEPSAPPASPDSSPSAPATTPPVGADTPDPLTPPSPPAPGMAKIRAIHASPGAPRVDVYAKGTLKPLLTNLGYGETSAWLEVPEGTYELELRASPSTASDPIAYGTGPLAVAKGTMISAIASGVLGSSDPADAFRLLPLAENFAPVAAGTVRVRAIHAGSDAPSVDLDVGNDDPSAPEVSGLARFSSTGAAGVELPAGKALAIGIDKDAARVTAFTTPALPSGAQLLVIATGLLGKLPREKDGFALLAVGPSGSVGFIKQDPTVYALHAGADAPAVDVFVGGAEIASNLSFGGLSTPIQVQPGAYTLDFFGASSGASRPAGAPAASTPTPSLEAGQRYLAVASGFLSNGTFTLLGYREGFAQSDVKAVVRGVHAAPDAPAVDIGLVDSVRKLSPVLFGNVSFSQASDEGGLTTDPASLFLGVARAGQATPIRTFTLPASAATRSFVVAAGALDLHAGPNRKSFRLLVVDTANAPWTVKSVLSH